MRLNIVRFHRSSGVRVEYYLFPLEPRCEFENNSLPPEPRLRLNVLFTRPLEPRLRLNIFLRSHWSSSKFLTDQLGITCYKQRARQHIRKIITRFHLTRCTVEKTSRSSEPRSKVPSTLSELRCEAGYYHSPRSSGVRPDITTPLGALQTLCPRGSGGGGERGGHQTIQTVTLHYRDFLS